MIEKKLDLFFSLFSVLVIDAKGEERLNGRAIINSFAEQILSQYATDTASILGSGFTRKESKKTTAMLCTNQVGWRVTAKCEMR